MKNKYNSDFFESLHETAVGLHNIGVINDKEMREYDQDCLVPAPQKSSESTGVKVKPTPVKKFLFGILAITLVIGMSSCWLR